MSTIADIADAVVAAINGATLPLPATSVRRWAPETRLDQLDDLRVDVVPASIAREPIARGVSSQDCTVLVVVQRRVGTISGEIDDANVDELVSETEAIAGLLDGSPMAGAAYLRMTHDPVASPDLLREHGLFRAVVAVTYKAAP